MRKTKTAKKNSVFQFFKKTVGSAQGFPIFISLCFISVLFVLFRMRSIELDYKISDLDKKIKKAQYENKYLKAQKAKLMSTKNLNKLASKHRLKAPDQKQIIIVP